MKIFEYRGFGLENLALADREAPRPAGREVVVKFRAASLNYRDVLFFQGGLQAERHVSGRAFLRRGGRSDRDR